MIQRTNGLSAWWLSPVKTTLILILCVLVSVIKPNVAYSQQIREQKVLLVKLADLIKDWPRYRNLVVTTKGKLHCLDTTHCDFLPTAGLRRTLFVRMEALDKDTRQRLFMGCFKNDCLVEVQGEVDDWELYAWGVWEVP